MKTSLIVLSLVIAIAPAGLPAPQPVPPPAPVLVKVEKDRIDFISATTLVTSYHVNNDQPRPYLWPLNAPGGIPTTRSWPMDKALPGEDIDHVHQRSAWFTYGDVIPEGIALKSKIKGIEGIDFWTEGKGRGKIICTKVEQARNPNSIITHNEWRTFEGEKIMDETRTVTGYNTGNAYLIVLDIDLEATVCPITFGDTKEGAMGVRVHTALTITKGKGTLRNADGKIGEKPCWGYKSAWCDYSGKIGENVVGVAVLDDPANRYPACWHAREYGLLAANCFGRDKGAKFPGMKGNNERVRLAKGEHLALRYGLVMHAGDAIQGNVAGIFEQFVKLRDADKK